VVKLLVTKGIFIFRGNNAYKGGNIGEPISGDVDAVEIIQHIQQKKTGNPFVSFSTKRAAGTHNSRGAEFFGKTVQKVSIEKLNRLVESGTIKIITPDDAFDIISAHPKKKVNVLAGSVKRNMQRNNEMLIAGQIPASVIRR